MSFGFLRQVIVPVPSGSNPLWLEKQESRKKIIRYVSLILLFILIAAAVVVADDYASEKDPNASDCKLGFSNTGCPSGYVCAGGIVACKDTGQKYKYALTGLILPEKKCNAPQIYKEYCVKNGTVTSN